mmetsp:Transcript_19045/g.41156  ORF Transcript_19045/g.41156 Transcript_19045/m.41156 type:complete len:205 (+) Transcript_19045:30-644(+)
MLDGNLNSIEGAGDSSCMQSALWQWRSQAGWREYEPEQALLIERAFKRQEAQVAVGPSHTVDLQRMLQLRNDDSARCRAVRRTSMKVPNKVLHVPGSKRSDTQPQSPTALHLADCFSSCSQGVESAPDCTINPSLSSISTDAQKVSAVTESDAAQASKRLRGDDDSCKSSSCSIEAAKQGSMAASVPVAAAAPAAAAAAATLAL